MKPLYRPLVDADCLDIKGTYLVMKPFFPQDIADVFSPEVCFRFVWDQVFPLNYQFFASNRDFYRFFLGNGLRVPADLFGGNPMQTEVRYFFP